MSKWNWIRHNGEILYEVGILEDGTLHNRGYPEDTVRAAVLAAEARRHERRSNAARKAAVTRARRQEQRIHQIAQRIVEGAQIGPRSKCCICRKGLADSESIARGIGSECWQFVLRSIERQKAKLKRQTAPEQDEAFGGTNDGVKIS